jgi:hypothetical protein
VDTVNKVEEIREGEVVTVRTGKGSGQFLCVMDGTHKYLQELEPGTVRRIAGRGGCVMAVRPGPEVEIIRAKNGKGGGG